MKRLTFGLAAVLAGLVAVPGLASALPAVTTESTDLRAGPAYDFPVVDQIPSGVTVNVHGCVRGYAWCDVSWRDARGWVAGQELAYLYHGERVTIVQYGPRIGFPVIGFAFDSYWNRYYRSRSWYGERARWRTVWRDRQRGEESAGERVKQRREDRAQSHPESHGYKAEQNQRRLNRPSEPDRRPDLRTGRREWRDRGESRGYLPQQRNLAPRQQMERGVRHNPGAGDRGPGGRAAGDRGSPGQGDRRH